MKNSPIVDTNLISWMRTIRRQLHEYPELGFQEVKTAALIGRRLVELDIPFVSGVAGTGIVAQLGCESPEAPCVALRADMDALAVPEKTGLPFASKYEGVMHACGHDGHVAMLLGAAAIVRQTPIPGRIKFVFQPSEEGESGAAKMVAEGVVDQVDAIFAGHIDRHLRVGEIAVHSGLICAYTDWFQIDIKGRGGHAAKPHETIDSIVVAGLLVMSLQTLVSREVNPSYPSVVTVGRINGGTAPNVIAEHASMEGTIRSTHPKIRQTIISGLTRMVESMQVLYNAETKITLKQGCPPVINTPTATAIATATAVGVVGKKGVKGLPYPSLGGEDFSQYLQKVPGCFVRFGGQKKGMENGPAHSSYFDFNENVLPIGADFLAKVAIEALRNIEKIRRIDTKHTKKNAFYP